MQQRDHRISFFCMESKILNVVGESASQMWGQYLSLGLICETSRVCRLAKEKSYRTRNRIPSFLMADVVMEIICLCQVRSCAKDTPTKSKNSLSGSSSP